MRLAAHCLETRPRTEGADFGICQTFAASPAEPGELPCCFSLNEGFAATLPAGVANYYDRTNQYPNVVAIVLPSGGACTGTLIVSRTVLTAAQLVIGAPYTLEVLLDTSLSAGAPTARNSG